MNPERSPVREAKTFPSPKSIFSYQPRIQPLNYADRLVPRHIVHNNFQIPPHRNVANSDPDDPSYHRVLRAQLTAGTTLCDRILDFGHPLDETDDEDDILDSENLEIDGEEEGAHRQRTPTRSALGALHWSPEVRGLCSGDISETGLSDAPSTSPAAADLSFTRSDDRGRITPPPCNPSEPHEPKTPERQVIRRRDPMSSPVTPPHPSSSSRLPTSPVPICPSPYHISPSVSSISASASVSPVGSPVTPAFAKAGLSPAKSPQHPSNMKRRKVSHSAHKILDAPGMVTDFHMHLLDWGSKNLLVVALGSNVYLWDATSSTVTPLASFSPSCIVSSVKFTADGTQVAVGLITGVVHMFDAATRQVVCSTSTHTQKVNVMAWKQSLLATAGKEKEIHLNDMRSPSRAPVSNIRGHRGEISGLKWSDDHMYLASGGRDQMALVWSATQSQQPVCKFHHQAAVKALAWSPHSAGMLATGGGNADRSIQVHNTATGQTISHTITHAQVCNMAWSHNINEIVTCHGYALPAIPAMSVRPSPNTTVANVGPLENCVVLWRPGQTLKHMATLQGHSRRVLHLSLSPDGQKLATGSADETIRFWEAFPPLKAKPTLRSSHLSSLMNIR